MGGPGSSRWTMTVTRLTIEGLPRLDVRALAKVGALKRGTTTTVIWGTGMTVRLSVPTNRVTGVQLACQAYVHGEGMIPLGERIWLTWTPCTFGGFRIWFRCPGCGTRCAVLHALGGCFRCRQCHNIAYASTRAVA